MVALMWTWRINPDNSAIPYLTALGDLTDVPVFGGMVKLGDRVSIGGYGAVVKYVGEVSGHPGMWVGVEWDNPDRGKHNGVVNGVRYFETSSAKGGSLVNIQNVNSGVNLLAAILNRYADAVDENDFVVSTKAVELVGMHSTSKKQSNIFELKHIVLESCSVVEPPPETCAQFRRCVSLNLFNNLLSRWEDIRKILMYFPKLQELVLRKNRMDSAVYGEQWREVNSLRDLILSDCGLTSESKLCVAGCGIERILIADNQFPSLTTLNIKDNVISEVIIAKLSGLVDLNRFDVSAVERQSAEVRFLDKYFSTDDSVRADHVDDIERLKKKEVSRYTPQSKESNRVLRYYYDASSPTTRHKLYCMQLRERDQADLQTLATTCLVLAAKYEEDRDIGVRDVINASHRILHPDGDPAKLDDHMYELRRGISELTFVVLRELNFDLSFGHPFDLLAIYLDTLRSWMPKEFSEKPIVDSCNIMLRDCYSVPEFVLSHSSHSLVIAVISLVLKGHDVDVPHSRDWFEVLHKSMTEQRLQKVELEIIRSVYGLHPTTD
ncbi:CAP-Gly domain protein [Teladorsagia circumcincta]|uniref:Tubulin-specific chaperone E n=1 Tax=Teladorsagia circumcincta TaxID=45464 RepID=A0A2G9UIU1_TELCI|nr:CAP-Gly domain protein [Teladorsagia circumcincta]